MSWSQMFGKKYFFSRFWNMIWDFMQFAQHANFWFDMSQLNLNNFWTDRATELRLDSKVAFFQAVSEYAFSAFRFHSDMLIFRGETQIRLFFWLKLYTPIPSEHNFRKMTRHRYPYRMVAYIPLYSFLQKTKNSVGKSWK